MLISVFSSKVLPEDQFPSSLGRLTVYSWRENESLCLVSKKAKIKCQNSSRNGISWTGKAAADPGVCDVSVGSSWEGEYTA